MDWQYIWSSDWHWIGPFVGAILGSIVTFVLQGRRAWWTRPILSLDRKAEGLITPADEFAHQTIIANCCYGRLFIFNRGLTTAQDVQVIVKYDALETEVLDAKWARQGGALKLHLPSKTGRYVDICCTRQSLAPGSPTLELWFSALEAKIPLRTELNLKIALAASNAKTVWTRVKFTHDGTLAGLKVVIPKQGWFGR